MGAILYSCPIRLVPTYILPAIEIRLLGSFHPNSFKTDRRIYVARSIRLVMLREKHRATIKDKHS